MVRFDIECTLPFPAAQFWLIRDTPSFLEFIVEDGLLKKLDATAPVKEEDGHFSRIQYYSPARVDCPDMIRAVIGDTMFDVADHQRWNPTERPQHLSFNIKPSFLSGVSRTYGELCVNSVPTPSEEQNLTDESDLVDDSNSTDTEPDSGNGSDSSDMEGSIASPFDYIDALPAKDKCLHNLTGETRVGILTVGWFIERAIVHNLRNFYRDYPATIARFHQKLYAEYADADYSVSVHDVVERYMKTQQPLIQKLESEAAQLDCEEEPVHTKIVDDDVDSLSGLSDISSDCLSPIAVEQQEELMMPS